MENPESSAKNARLFPLFFFFVFFFLKFLLFFSVRSKPYVPNLSLLKTPQICTKTGTKIRYLTLFDEDDEAVREKGSSTVDRKPCPRAHARKVSFEGF